MRMWVVLIVMATTLAGCSESPAPVEEDDFSDDLEKELVATSETGVIRGVVVDPAIVPVPGATIKLVGTEKSTTSNDKGEFGFGSLDPGTYFMEVSKLGFLKVQQGAEVKAGVAAPPIVKVLLERDINFNPYYNQLYYKGMYECGTSVVVVCAAPYILSCFTPLGCQSLTADTSTPTITFDENPTFIQTEMVWESTQPLGPQLYFEMEALDDNCPEDPDRIFLGSARGESPIRTRVNETRLQEGKIGGPDCGIYYSIFSGDATGGASPVGAGVSIQQDFEWFITEFHGYEPPEEWWFIETGSVPGPAGS